MNEFIIENFITLFDSPFFELRVENSKQDTLQYSNFDWTNEPYAYTISAMLSTRTSPARRNSFSWLVNSSKPITLPRHLSSRLSCFDCNVYCSLCSKRFRGVEKQRKTRNGPSCPTETLAWQAMFTD